MRVVYALALLLLTGACRCHSAGIVESPILGKSSGGHAAVCNYGWTILSLMPVASENPDGWTTSFFRNTVVVIVK